MRGHKWENSESSKFGREATYKICEWDVIDRVITDSDIGKDFIEFFDSANIKTNIVDNRAMNDHSREN